MRGSSLYVTGYLSIIDDLLLVRIMQINFIESYSPSHKRLNYAWEKKQVDNSSHVDNISHQSLSATEIAKSLLVKPRKRKSQSSILSRPLKVPKLASLALAQSETDEYPPPSLQLNADSNSQSDAQPNIPNDNISDVNEEVEVQETKQRKGRRKRNLK